MFSDYTNCVEMSNAVFRFARTESNGRKTIIGTILIILNLNKVLKIFDSFLQNFPTKHKSSDSFVIRGLEEKFPVNKFRTTRG